MLSVDLHRDLLVANLGERCTDICTATQHLCDNRKMSDGTLLLVMAMEIKLAEIAILNAIIKHTESIKHA